MPLTWPSSLPQVPALGWVDSIGDNTIRTKTSAGPAKVRPRYTSSVDRMTWPLIVTTAQWIALKAFYKTTTASGSLQFDITHPLDDSLVSVRFIGKPGFAQDGPGMFRGNLTFEIIPG